jgi:pimeloyl-ACP methyl ester carboxylesterase
MPLVEFANIRLYYEEHGSGPALVLAHGNACGVRSWDPQLRVLTDRYTVIVYDGRGHGLSEAPREASAYSNSTWSMICADSWTIWASARRRWGACPWAEMSCSISHLRTRSA